MSSFVRSYHRQTEHTWTSVRSGRSLDWSSQPGLFKQYPEQWPELPLGAIGWPGRFLALAAGISAIKEYPGLRLPLRTVPSAGALYPCELYVQSRGMANIEDGIYHFEPLAGRLRQLHLLGGKEGLEGYWFSPERIQGLVLLVTAIYYRSSWKYGHRALRYCLLDGGHLLGGIEAAACCVERSCQFVTRFDRDRVAQKFSFGKKELPLAMAVIGQETHLSCQPPALHLVSVDRTGSFVRDPLIEDSFAAMANIEKCLPGRAGQPYGNRREELEKAIWRRRSIRAFAGGTMQKEQFHEILASTFSPAALDCDEQVETYRVVHRVEDVKPGIYDERGLIRKGDFRELSGYLCLEQDLGADGCCTLFLTGSANNYLPMMLKAGLLGHRLYLAATMAGAGCSGIGAFYDQEVADFLETENLILYALAFGY